MAAMAEVLEAKRSYFDYLSFTFSPHPAQIITFDIKAFIFGALSAKTLFHLEPSLN